MPKLYRWKRRVEYAEATQHKSDKLPFASDLLVAEAQLLAPILHEIRTLLSPVDFVCSFLLLYTSIRNNGNSLSGRLNPNVIKSNIFKLSYCDSRCCYEVPGLMLSEHDKALIAKTLHHAPSLVELFAYFALPRVPVFVNTEIVSWAAGERTLELLFHMPSPRELLSLQATGKRVITAWLQESELCQYVGGRDPMEFLMHDLQHSSHFYKNRELYLEQVGVFDLLQHVLTRDNCSLLVLSQLDVEFREDLDYVISDMNASSTHILGMLKAKWVSASIRQPELYSRSAMDSDENDSQESDEINVNTTRMYLTSEQETAFVRVFESEVNNWDIDPCVADAFRRLCSDEWRQDKDQTIFAEYFQRRGENVMFGSK